MLCLPKLIEVVYKSVLGYVFIFGATKGTKSIHWQANSCAPAHNSFKINTCMSYILYYLLLLKWCWNSLVSSDSSRYKKGTRCVVNIRHLKESK
jgi:hypothetical protein